MIGSLTYPRSEAAATSLGNGQVLITGGATENNVLIPQAELYNSSSGTFSIAGNLNIPRWLPLATLLSDGCWLDCWRLVCTDSPGGNLRARRSSH